VLQLVVDLVREALIGLLFDLYFFAVVVCLEFGALPIHIVELQDSKVSKRAGFSNRGASIQKLLEAVLCLFLIGEIVAFLVSLQRLLLGL